MKNLKLLIAAFIAVCLFSANGFSQNKASKPVFSLVEVPVQNQMQLKKLIAEGFDMDFHSTKKKDHVRIFAMDKDLNKLKQLGYHYSVVHEDMSKFMQGKLQNPSAKSLQIGQGSMGGYFNYDEVIDYIDSMQNEYSSIMSVPAAIGQTIEGNDIMAYKISDNPTVTEDEPRSLITGLHHAREPMAIIAPLYFTQWLLSNYGTDEMATYIVDNREVWFVPVVNVDGYLYNELIEPNGGGMWRKNKRDNDGNGAFEPDNDGVDLNRNYGYGWGYDNNGSSPDPSSETYRGASAFSEPETEAIRQFCIDHGFKTALNFHTFGDLMIYSEEPDGTVFPDQNIFREYGHDATKGNGYVFGNGTETVQYVTNGDSDAWMYGEQEEKDKIMAFTPEIGTQFDYFWAPTDRIMELAEENLYTQQYIVMAAGVYLKIDDYRFNDLIGGDGDMAAEANETVDLIVSVRNKGWDFDAQDVTASLAIDDANVTVNTTSVVASFGTSTTDEITFSISLSDQIISGYTTEIEIIFTDAQGYNITETHELIFGKPFIKFYDNAEEGMDNWVAEGNWGLTDEKSSDGEFCFTDSPYDVYDPDSETSLILAQQIDLNGLNNAYLTFKTRYNMERDWDMAQLQISTDNGATWEPIAGEYSTNGAGNDGVQPLNTPVYNGNRDLDWVLEIVPLANYIDEQVLFRFVIETDGGVEEDGWYIDDIKLIGYTDEAVMPEVLSVTQYQNTDFLGPYPVDAVVSDDQGDLAVDMLYSTDGVVFSEVAMTANDFFNYSAEIPSMSYGTTVSYYVRIIDAELNKDSSEIYNFIVTNDPPDISVNIDEIVTTLGIGQTEEHTLTITNSGLLPLDWSISAISIEPVEKDPFEVITDPEGDQTAGSPDFIAISAELLTESIFVELTFAQDVTNNNLSLLLIDADQDGETGYTGEDLFGYPGWDIGIEYIVLFDLANQFGAGEGVFLTNADLSTIIATLDYDIDGNNISTTFNLEDIGNDDGNIDIAAICGSEQGFDAAPDEGHGTIGNPGVASWLSIASLSGTTYAGNTEDIVLTVRATNVPPAIYNAEIIIDSNDPDNATITIPVTLTVLSNQNNIVEYSFAEQTEPANISEGNHTVNIEVMEGTDVTNLVAEFTISDGATVEVDGVVQVSGTTPNDFTNSVVYTITAEDGTSIQNWTVNVSIADGVSSIENNDIVVFPNPAKDIIKISGVRDAVVTIYDIMGKEKITYDITTENQKIDVSSLQNGTYLLKIKTQTVCYSKLMQISK